MIERIRELCSLFGASGREDAVRDYILSQIPSGVETTVDALGNVIIFRKGRRRANHRVMLCAHMDEVGLMITHITDDGFLKFDTVGGISIPALCGKAVRVGDKLLPGVIGVKPVHLLHGDEEKQYPKGESMYIDVGAADKEEAAAVVSVGDYAYFDSDVVSFGDGYLKGRALDDRCGCAIMLEMLHSDLEYDLYFAFTVQEETGIGGAGPAAFRIDPEYAIVLETTTASDIDGVEGERKVCCLGKGAVISQMDRRTVYLPKMYEKAFSVAREHGIPAQPKTVVAGGNDAGVIYKTRAGVAVQAISLPCRYLHSPSCVITEKDYYASRDLAALLAAELAQ
ncbi:MAG: M20/M25/M40 family metallo-hydrolase [Clostridia bacterium]|nr:M20/M25/M40 family metallo-hydrolase [Clostridia bacterium]